MKIHILLSTLLIPYFLFQNTVIAAPTINWNTKKLNTTVMQGTYQLHKVKIKFNQNFETVAPVVDPKLQKWVTVSPSYIYDIKTGQEKEFSISISIPEDEPLDKYRGKLRIANVAQDGSRKNIGSPFHIVFTIDKLVINDTLPPDPGELGKMTIEGIDADADGLRDDLQRYIAIKYQSSEKLRRVMTDLAKANQDFILNVDNDTLFLEARKNSSRQLACLFYIDPENSMNHFQKLRAKSYNTETRFDANIRGNSKLGGTIITLPENNKAQCSFDPDSLDN